MPTSLRPSRSRRLWYAFGVSPTDWVFGAKQFGLDFDPTLNHTNYWDGDYSSNSVRQSMAAINTGLYGSVR
ncbi:hypothetical protein GCM10009827_059060 [Dactylosporangium maewongense]|uniref:Uncharacterized protein n=1 Tax=Dactylosporangium maewongense TaxID=634393 RepID=A0ABN2B655_9ACTN